ncbi:metallophosphoesterase [Neobacillus sp. D3-1R]|uniref:metallophosphoesterase n=1 Tax=Neobacillus sp. D3-1R TaxID=3445778 RepID=UPI003FA11F30
MNPRVVFRILIFFIIYTALTFYIGWNLWAWLHAALGLEDKWVLGIILILLSYSYLIGRFHHSFTIFKIIGAYWFGILQYAVLILPVANLMVFILTLLGFSPETVIAATGTIVIITFIGLLLYGTFNAYSPIIRTYTLEIPKLVSNRTQLRIAMASDMHFGNLSGLAHSRRLVKNINDMKPDLILLPGDIIDDDPKPFIQKKMGDVLKDLSAPLGIYGVLGNHEYYGRAIPEFIAEMNRIGIKILQDEIVKIDESFFLVGRKDKTDHKRQSIEGLVKGLDHTYPIIMMDHQPAEIKQAVQNGMDLLLSGHTHRGQMAPNHLITRRIFDLDWGHQQFNQLHAIVSSGFGFWGPPLRIGSRSEIIQIDVSFTKNI